jgi:trans-aconitate methyltransferase
MRRALSFGGVAAAYERFRPDYPAGLVDVVLRYAQRPVRTALEIGAGTGKATRLFAAHGIAVTATDPDAEMLAELRAQVPANAAPVRTTFEDFRPTNPYDVVYAAASLHWTEPEGRFDRVAAALRPDGTFACIGMPVRVADPAVDDALRAAWAPFLDEDKIVAPGLPAPAPGQLQWPGEELQRSEHFADVCESVIERRLTVSAAEYVGLLSTISAFIVLPDRDRRQVFDRTAHALPEQVELIADTVVQLARRSGGSA